MGVHYPKGFVGRCADARLKPVTICIGSDLQWQGGVDQTMQLKLLGIMQECEQQFPVSNLPAASPRARKGTPPEPPAGTVPAPAPAPSANGQPAPEKHKTPTPATGKAK